jgi:HlyD family secretion protein
MGSLGGKFIFTLAEGNYANKTSITTGASSVEYIEITSGLASGQQVITSDYSDFNTAEKIYLGD